jgi:hypothetical protein
VCERDVLGISGPINKPNKAIAFWFYENRVPNDSMNKNKNKEKGEK